MHLLERHDEFDVGPHMRRLAEFHEAVEDRIGHDQHDEHNKVDRRNDQKQRTFALLAVIHLPQPRQDRHHCCHVGIAGISM